MTRRVERASYRAVVKKGADEAALACAVDRARSDAAARIGAGELLTAGMYRHGDQLFCYLEHIWDDRGDAGARPDLGQMRRAPEAWGWLEGLTEPFPSIHGPRCWAYMYPVFWFDEPRDAEHYRRDPAPDERCGRIAVLCPDKLMEYVCHHQAIVAEATFVGDRYQFISIHDDVLFSYFERPRDRGQRSISGVDGPSEEIGRWLAVDPASHFDHFPEANGDDFLVIDTLFALGPES